jgi:hypothetical protein
MAPVTLTLLRKAGGPLTKTIRLNTNGHVVSDSSACLMSSGTAERIELPDINALAALIDRMTPDQALALGALRPDLPDHCDIVTRRRLAQINGTPQPDLIARTGHAICYQPQQPAYVLFDHDTKGMPPEVAARIAESGSFFRALSTVLPAVRDAARLGRTSTSAGLYRADTGERLPHSGGVHVYVAVRDGDDSERFLRDLHARCWLAGFGWMMVGAGGQLLERSIIDRMVGAPERLVFEGAPVLEPPLAQDPESRRPSVRQGEALDTLAACPPLSILEQTQLRELCAKEAHRLAPVRARRRRAFVTEQAKRLAASTGLTQERAEQVIERQCKGVLLPHVVLAFDDDEFAGCTVADVLANPARFEDATLADPLEGIDYGRGKAKVMLRADGTPWVHSFAHGRTVYELCYDAHAVRAAIEAAAKDEAGAVFVRVALAADLDAVALNELMNLAAARSGIGKRALQAMLKGERATRQKEREREEQARRQAERRDPRPQISAPPSNAEWLPQMQLLNDVLGTSRDAEPPARDIDGVAVQVRVRRLPNMHALTSAGVNDGEAEETRLPAPDQPLLTRLSEPQLAEQIERHIEYVDAEGRPVHLASEFVRHYRIRTDNALPVMTAISTLPIVLADRTVLAGRGLDRERGIVFRVPRELMALLPRPEDCTEAAVAQAMDFLINAWLCDVAADYTGKCILLAAALSIIERSLLPDRPVVFVTAGRRGSGKTTTLIMLIYAVTGIRPAAAAWSSNEEERRKALLAYFMEAIPAIIWDNIPRGARISCPHIEKACTAAFYSDRRLGVSEIVAVAASVIQMFTGNNVAPKGDLASRALQVRLEVDRADPENRHFTHPDPIAWTEAHRGQILHALFVILLGNPAIRPGANATPQTRFKVWWRLVGSAIEHAATQHAECGASREVEAPTVSCPVPINFRDLFVDQEQDDEESASLADVLDSLSRKWPAEDKFHAADIAKIINDTGQWRTDDEVERSAILRELLFADAQPNTTVTAKATGKRLSRHVGEPVVHRTRTLILREVRDRSAGPKGALAYYVQVKD